MALSPRVPLFEKTLETLQKKTVNNSSVNVTLACSILDLLTNQARKAEGESLKKVSEARASSKNWARKPSTKRENRLRSWSVKLLLLPPNCKVLATVTFSTVETEESPSSFLFTLWIKTAF